MSEFRGLSIDGCPLLVAVTASHRFPRPALSIQGDLFALGSTLFEIMAGVVPLSGYNEEQVKAQYTKRIFPETGFLGSIGDIITRCWNGRYSHSEVICADLADIYAPEHNEL